MIGINVNNGRKIFLTQIKNDIFITTLSSNKEVESCSLINECDMVMLLNYYRHIKENDIQCDFINPNGKETK